MTAPTRIHRYRGHEIRPTGWADSPGRWYVQTYHALTGLPWDEAECPQGRTLAELRDYIDREIGPRILAGGTE